MRVSMDIFILVDVPNVKRGEMNILSVNTGDAKLDEAYKKHSSAYFYLDKVCRVRELFNSVAKTDDKEVLLRWLLKVLFVEFKYGRTQNKHDFDILLERVSTSDKEKLENWLKEKLEKVGGVWMSFDF